MLPFGVTIPATVPQKSEIPEGLMNYYIYIYIYTHTHTHTHTYRVFNPANVDETYIFFSGTPKTRPKHNGRATSEESVRTADEGGANCMFRQYDRSSRTGQSAVRG